MSVDLEIKNKLNDLCIALEKMFSLVNIRFKEVIDDITDIRCINFTEAQDQFYNENLVKIIKIINGFLEFEEDIKDSVLLANLKYSQTLFIKLRSNHNLIYNLIKLYWSIKNVLTREDIILDENYNNDIINYNWILKDEITEFLELLINKKTLPIESKSYCELKKKRQDTIIDGNLIEIKENNIFPTSLSKKLINSINVTELFNYYQYDFTDILEECKY